KVGPNSKACGVILGTYGRFHRWPAKEPGPGQGECVLPHAHRLARCRLRRRRQGSSCGRVPSFLREGSVDFPQGEVIGWHLDRTVSTRGLDWNYEASGRGG